MSKPTVHYWWDGTHGLSSIACGVRSLVVSTRNLDEVTCLSCRKTWRFKNNGVVRR